MWEASLMTAYSFQMQKWRYPCNLTASKEHSCEPGAGVANSRHPGSISSLRCDYRIKRQSFLEKSFKGNSISSLKHNWPPFRILSNNNLPGNTGILVEVLKTESEQIQQGWELHIPVVCICQATRAVLTTAGWEAQGALHDSRHQLGQPKRRCRAVVFKLCSRWP